MTALGKIEKIEDLRTIWKHEAHDFSKWLAQEENLALLSKAIGIDMVLKETESSVGSFSVDLFASEEGTGRKIIIENQLEDTDHDHLGKIITYASGKGAEVIVWIVKRARDEHRQAIEWLNQHTDENIGFFLVEIELWRINDSLPAPKFTIIEKPNDWAKTMKVVEGNLYSVDGTILYRYAPAKDATSFTVPEGVTTIGDYAFANATNLTEVIIPSEVVTVGNEMFFGTTNVVVKVEASEVSANYPNDWAKYAKDVVYDYLTGDDDDNIVEF